MALSPADFAAYSRATGVPYPEDPEERAALVPEVLEFRRSQLQQPKEESNLPGILGAAIAGLGALGAGAYGIRRLGARPKSAPVQKVTGVNLTDLSRVKQTSTPPPSRVAAPIGATPAPKTAIPEATFNLSDFVKDSAFQKQLELEEAEAYSAMPEAQQEMRRATRAVQGVESKEKALAKNVLLELRREQEAAAIPQATVNLTPEFTREPPTPVAKIGPHTVIPTRANQPGAFTDLTTIQEQLLNQARNQQVNAVEAGEDQVAQRARRKTTSLLRSQKAETSPALQKLYDAGLDEFEINARINAFAQYDKPEFLDPNYNAATVGPENFARTLDVNAAEFDRSGRLIGGEYASGSQTVEVVAGSPLKRSAGPALPSKYVTLPEGEIKRSAFASQQPRPVRTRSQNDEEKWEPISEALTGLTGGVSTASVPIMQSEQYQEAINNFRGYWDDQVRAHLAGEQSSITRPARRNRLVDSYDLDMPVRLRNVETRNEAGDLVKTTETVLYRDVLPKETVEAIERGEQMNLDVPFLVDKNRAIAVAEANPTIQNRLDAEQYKATGRALVRAHQKIVGPYAADQYVTDARETSYFQRSLNPEGQPDVTPSSGRGSQKGRLVGGIAEEPVREPVFPLYYAPHETAAGKKILVSKAAVLDEAGNLGEVGVTTFKQLNELGVAKDVQGAELYVSPGQQIEYITTQPMAVKRPLQKGAAPVGTVTRQGQYGKFTSDVYEAADTIVQAPLQVLDAKTGKTISSVAQIKRDELAGYLNSLRNSTGVKDYAELGSLANRYLAEQKGITLPVLDSPTAFDFIEGVIGRASSRPSRKSFVTVNQKTGDVYPLSREEAQQLGFAGGSVVEPSLSRKYVGPPSLDIRQSPRSAESWSRMGESDTDWEQYKDFGDEGLGVANVGVLMPRQSSELQQRLRPATTGPGAELQELREQIAKIEPKETRFSSEPLPSNLEVVTQQLMAQAGRRAGKRRNR